MSDFDKQQGAFHIQAGQKSKQWQRLTMDTACQNPHTLTIPCKFLLFLFSLNLIGTWKTPRGKPLKIPVGLCNSKSFPNFTPNKCDFRSSDSNGENVKKSEHVPEKVSKNWPLFPVSLQFPHLCLWSLWS